MPSSKVSTAAEAFEDVLEGRFDAVTNELAALTKVARALAAERPTSGPSPAFKAMLRARLAEEATLGPAAAFAAALEGHAAPETEMAGLVAIATALEPDALPEPSPAFRFRLRNQLVAAAAARPSMGERIAGRLDALNGWMRRSRKAVGALGLAAVMMLGSGSALAASSSALPPDGLYELKRFRENVQLSISSGSARGTRLLGYARTRLVEVRGMTERGISDPTPFVDTLNDMDAHTVEGTKILIESYRATREEEHLTRVASFASVQAQDLSSLVERIPGRAKLVARDSIETLAQVELRVRDVLAGCPCPANPLVEPATPRPGSDQACVACGPRPSSNTSEDRPRPDRDPGEGGGGGNGGGNEDPGGGGGDPEPEPAVDLPDELPDDPEQQLEDLLDQLLDDIASSAPPIPLPGGTTLPTGPGL